MGGKKTAWAMVALLFCALLTSCASDPAFVQHMRETHDAVAPEYLELVNESPRFNEEQRVRRARTVQIWRESVEAQERGR